MILNVNKYVLCFISFLHFDEGIEEEQIIFSVKLL